MKRTRVVMTLSNPFKVDPRVYKEALTLVNSGYEVTILAWDREGTHPLREIVDGIKVERIRVRAKYGSIIGFVVALPLFYIVALIRLLKMDFDVIHTHDFDTAPLGALIKLLRGKAWIFDIHDIYFTRISLLKERSSMGILQRILMKMEVLHAKFADIVIVVTRSLGRNYEGFKEFYIKLGVPPDKIRVVWNTPHASMFLNYPKLNLKKPTKFTIGYIGSIRTVSNFIPLFELAKKRGYKLLFVGGGKSKEDVEKIARERFPDVDAEFTGAIPYELISNYYLLCDVLYSYFPPTENVKRTITVKVFESAFLGVPVIVNAESLMEDFVRLNNCGVAIKEPSIMELEKAIDNVRTLKFNPKRIQEKWRWEAQEGLILSIYGRLIKRATE